MTDQGHSRDAAPTIRGYLYQFDATILAILRLANKKELTVEGIEDFDIGTDAPSDLFQCKYITSKCLTPSELRDAILPMLEGFLGLEGSLRRTRRFHLYAYFRDCTPGDKPVTLKELKNALVRRKRITLPSGQTKTEVFNLQNELGASDNDLRVFARNLTVHLCAEYATHKEQVVKGLKTVLGVSLLEARDYLYPSALTAVTRLAVEQSMQKKKITKADFIRDLRPSRALFSAWTIREKGETRYCRDMRRVHFRFLNIDPVHRFFIIEMPPSVEDAELLSLVYAIRSKWSSHSVKRKPTDDRYAPYLYFRGLAAHRLVSLKLVLQSDGVRFVDGYPFAGSDFSLEHLASQQTYENQISMRFVNSHSDLRQAIEGLKGQREFYDFLLMLPSKSTQIGGTLRFP